MPPSHVKALLKAVLLCIDDNQLVLECEKAFLETSGYTVLTAPSGREGLELACLHSFDVVIVDYCMPEMNGQEFAIAMRRLRPLAPIIMVSGTVDVPEQALKVVDAFVAKDCLDSQLLPAIALLCGCKSLPPSSEKSIHSKRPIKQAGRT
jgi:CheY-like chemotaxis protein